MTRKNIAKAVAAGGQWRAEHPVMRLKPAAEVRPALNGHARKVNGSNGNWNGSQDGPLEAERSEGAESLRLADPASKPYRDEYGRELILTASGTWEPPAAPVKEQRTYSKEWFDALPGTNGHSNGNGAQELEDPEVEPRKWAHQPKPVGLSISRAWEPGVKYGDLGVSMGPPIKRGRSDPD